MLLNQKKTIGLMVALILGSSAPLASQDLSSGIYGRVFGGISNLSDTDLSGGLSGSTGFDTGQVFGAAVGYQFSQSPVRAELEYAYRTADPDGSSGLSGDFASTTVALNGYYLFSPSASGRLTPYIGAGLAYVTELDFDVESGARAGEYNDTGLWGYQIMVGADYALTDRWSINGELRYFDAGSQTLTNASGDSLNADYDSIDLLVGATFRF